MKRYLLFLCLCLSASTLIFAQRQTRVNPVNPNPGGSPFSPGKEPSLTHTATAFWTTLGGLTTEIRIKTDGVTQRATQSEYWKMDNGNKEFLGGGISPNCDYHMVFSSTKSNKFENVGRIIANGQGGIEVRIFGFKPEDFKSPPVVTVSYSKDGKVLGETKIVSHPMPDKFKKTEQ